jgi:RNA polymerase sigma-70 factor, ECF subfamily
MQADKGMLAVGSPRSCGAIVCRKKSGSALTPQIAEDRSHNPSKIVCSAASCSHSHSLDLVGQIARTRVIEGGLACCMTKQARRGFVDNENNDRASLSDETLSRWASGDRQAFLDAVRPWQDAAHRIAGRIVGNLHDAEEVWQSLMLRLLRNEVALPPAAKFGAWLRRCAVNESIGFLRHRRASLRARQEFAGVPRLEPPEPAEEFLDGEQHSDIQQALARLSDEQRALLSLRFDEGLTVREIADVLEQPRSTVHFQLEQAVQLLRDQLGVGHRKVHHE